MESLSWESLVTVIIGALATWRLYRLVFADSITAPWRRAIIGFDPYDQNDVGTPKTQTRMLDLQWADWIETAPGNLQLSPREGSKPWRLRVGKWFWDLSARWACTSVWTGALVFGTLWAYPHVAGPLWLGVAVIGAGGLVSRHLDP